MEEQDIIYKNTLKIYDFAILMRGYCENADGSAIFVSCMESVLKDIENLALENLEHL